MRLTKFTALLAFAALVGFALPHVGHALDLHIGKWKLNPGKSKNNSSTPKNETRTYEQQGNETKVIVKGVDANGNKIDYEYTIATNGQDAAVTGVGVMGAADTIEVRNPDPNTTETIFKKNGKVVGTTTSVVSKDGKTMTVTSKGTDPNGIPIDSVLVFDRA